MKKKDLEFLDEFVGLRAKEIQKATECQDTGTCLAQAVSETLNRYRSGEIKILPFSGLSRTDARGIGEILDRLNSDPDYLPYEDPDYSFLMNNTIILPGDCSEPTN